MLNKVFKPLVKSNGYFDKRGIGLLDFKYKSKRGERIDKTEEKVVSVTFTAFYMQNMSVKK